MIRARVRELMHGESDSVALQSCRLLYQILCEERTRADSGADGRPLRVVFHEEPDPVEP